MSSKFWNDASIVAELDLPDDPFFDDLRNNPQSYAIMATFPVNNPKDSSIWGIELEAEQQFLWLPSMWSGLGMFGNVTYTKSDRVRLFAVDGELLERRGEPFANSPEFTGSAGITYEKYGFDGLLSYSFQDKAVRSTRNFGLDDYTDSIGTLDFRLEYSFEASNAIASVFVEGRDILSDKDESFESIVRGGEDGVPEYLIGERYLGGRELRVGFRMTF